MSVFPESLTRALTFSLDWITVLPTWQQPGGSGKATGGRGPGHLPARLPGDRAVHPFMSAGVPGTNSAGRAGGSRPHVSRAWKGSAVCASVWRCFPRDPSILGWGEAGSLSVCLAIIGKCREWDPTWGRQVRGGTPRSPGPGTGPFSMPCVHPALQGFLSGGVGSISTP